MGIASFERFYQVWLMTAEGFMMTLGKMAPGRGAERTVQTVAFVTPLERAFTGFNEDRSDWFINHDVNDKWWKGSCQQRLAPSWDTGVHCTLLVVCAMRVTLLFTTTY